MLDWKIEPSNHNAVFLRFSLYDLRPYEISVAFQKSQLQVVISEGELSLR